jgi:broad specificity phosphatase PhoE
MKNSYCTIYLIRHGETEWNKKKLIQGQTDTPLNKKGEIQAKELEKKFKGINFSAVFSSNLIRARKTAELMFLEKKLAVVTTKALRERFYGRFEGKHINELRKIIGELVFLSRKKQKKLKLYDVESDNQIVNRLTPFLRETAVAYPGKNVLMVSHGGLMRTFLSHLGYKIPEYSKKSMKNAGYLIIESDGVEFTLKKENLFQ